METTENYLEVNKALWNERTDHHIDSSFYDNEGFKNGRSSLNRIELDLLGNVKDRSILHLQCHFGQDTLSLARMGAKVTGIDLSDNAINKARQLADELNVEAEFICSDVYQLPQKLDRQFDMVFTTYGVLGWLPDMKKWAEVVAHFLKPGGQLILVEMHPAVWMFDNDFTHVQYSYFNRQAIIENEQGTYADKGAAMQLESVSWNHDLAEVLQSIINAGLEIKVFSEFDYCPYNCLANMTMVEDNKFCIKGMEGKLPMVYAVSAIKK